MNKISVIISVYQENENHLRAAIESILQQTYKNLELIIVIDEKNKSTTQIIKAYQRKDSRIKIIQNQKNLGLTKSLNLGIKKASGDYIARMDGDDISLPDRFKKQLAHLKKNKLDLIGSYADLIDEQGNLSSFDNSEAMPQNLKSKLIRGNIFTHSTFFGTRQVFSELYNENFYRAQDYEFVLRVLSQGYKLGLCPEALLQYRINPNGISYRNFKAQMWNVIKIQWLALRKYHYPIFSGLYGMLRTLIIILLPSWLIRLLRKKPQSKTLGVFFTPGISLDHWQDRELLIYRKLIEQKVFGKIYFFTYGSSDRDISPYLKVIKKPRIFVGRLGNLLYSLLLPILRRKYIKQCDYLKTNQVLLSWTAVIAKKIFKKPLIVRAGFIPSLNNLHAKQYLYCLFNRQVEKLAYRHADQVVISSSEQARYLKKQFGIKNPQIIPPLIDTEIFQPDKKTASKDLVFVGRLHPEKNLDALITAITSTRYKLDIYGKGSEKKHLQKLIKAKKAGDQIKLRGQIDNKKLARILPNYKLYVLCSKYEGLPKTLLEAMSSGLACLGTDVSGIRELIEDKKTGLLSSIKSDNLHEQIKLLMQNKKLRHQLGKNARHFIEQNYSPDSILKKEKLIYRN